MKKLLTLLLCIASFGAMAQSTTWYQIQTGSHKQLNTIAFGSASVGYIGGNDSLLLKTIDGGKTWDSLSFTGVSFLPSGEHIVNLKFVSETVGYMTVGPYTGTYKTSDGGASWTAISFSGNMCYNQGMYLFSEDNGAFGGSGCFQGEHIEMMSSGTLTASTINTPSWTAQDVVLDIDFLNANFGLAVSQSRFLRTTDGGASWDTIPSGFPGLPLTSIEIINDTLAYAGYIDVGSNFGLLKTTDAGLTWTQEGSMATFYYPDYHDVKETANGYVYAAAGTDMGSEGIIFEDVGAGWWFYPVDNRLRAIDSYNDSTVFAVGDSGYVVTNIDPALLSNEKASEDFFSMELYPNPTSGTLQFSVPESLQLSNFTVKIYSLNGEEILNFRQNQQGVDVSSLSAGLYILEVTTTEHRYVSKFQKN